MLEKLNWFHFTSLLTLVLLIWEWMGLFLRKNHFLRCWSWLFLLKWIGALTLTLLLKLPPKKLEPGLVLKFLSHEVALYLCKSTFWPYLELLDKMQKWICKTVGSSLAAFFQSLAHRWNVVFSIGITLVGVYLSWLNSFHFLILEGGLIVVLIDCMVFLLPFADVTSMSKSTAFFLAKLDSGILCL